MTQTPEPRYTLQEAANHLHMRHRDLFDGLRRRRVLDNRNLPAPRYKAAGLFIEREASYQHPTVGVRFYSRTFVTARGLAWLRDLFTATATS